MDKCTLESFENKKKDDEIYKRVKNNDFESKIVFDNGQSMNTFIGGKKKDGTSTIN